MTQLMTLFMCMYTDHNSITIEFGVQFYSVGCDKIEFVQENTRGAVMNIEPNAVVKKPSMSNDASSMGCIISGSIITDKVGGYFSFKIASENRNKNMFDPRFASMLHRDLTPVDLSHQIKHLMFMPTDRSIGRVIPKDVWPSDDKDHPLNGAIIRLDNSTGLYAYNLFVVPMTYKTIYGYEKHLNKYRVTEKAESLQNVLSRGVVIGLNSYRDISVVFDYDFYPIMLAINETREGFIEFIANLCGIIGGAITVLGLVDAALHKITKAGKRD